MYKQTTYKQDATKSTYLTSAPPHLLLSPTTTRRTAGRRTFDRQLPSDFVLHTRERSKNYNAFTFAAIIYASLPLPAQQRSMYKQTTYKQDATNSTYLTSAPPHLLLSSTTTRRTAGRRTFDRQLLSDFVLHTQERSKNYNAFTDYFWLLIFSVDLHCRLCFTVCRQIFLSSSK